MSRPDAPGYPTNCGCPTPRVACAGPPPPEERLSCIALTGDRQPWNFGASGIGTGPSLYRAYWKPQRGRHLRLSRIESAPGRIL